MSSARLLLLEEESHGQLGVQVEFLRSLQVVEEVVVQVLCHGIALIFADVEFGCSRA